MITVLSLNPCLDKTMKLDCFDPDAPNRVEIIRTDLGGKGVNVARVLSAFPGNYHLAGFDFQGRPVEKTMASLLPCHLIETDGELRVNLKIRETAGRTIEINERGMPVDADTLNRLEQILLEHCKAGDFAALCGSLPPGVPVDTYGRLCRLLKAKGCFVAVDCDGPALLAALDAMPHLIKPNAQEFFALTGISPDEEGTALRACRALHEKGVQMICLSRGPKGALLSTHQEAFSCPAADVAVQGTAGAGDSMLAGLLMALERGDNPREALRFASAVAGASIMLPGTQLCRREDAQSLLPSIPIPQRCF